MAEFVKWLMVAWLTLGALLTITVIGKPRKPITSGMAVAIVITMALEIVAILAYWQG